MPDFHKCFAGGHLWAGPVLMLLAVTSVSRAGEEGRYAVRDIHHSSWTSENGVGAVRQIAQDSDGYLWLSTANGVVRFDGVRFQSVKDATNNALSSAEIRSAYVAPSGRIYFRTRTAGLILLEHGKASVYSNDRRCISVAESGGMAEDTDGSLWIRGLSGLYHLRGFSCEMVSEADGYPGGFPAAILVDHEGTVWVKAPSGALLFLRKGTPKFELSQFVSEPTSHGAFLHEDPEGNVWLSDEKGLRRISARGRQIPIATIPSSGSQIGSQFGDFAFGADGTLWAVLNKGISRFDRAEWRTKGRVNPGGDDRASRFDGLSSNAVWSLEIDHEGSVWVGTNAGLDRLRVTPLKTVLLPFADERQFGLAPADDGSVWTGNTGQPLTRVYSDGRFTRVDKLQHAICIRRDQKGTIWFAAQGPNRLWRLAAGDFSRVHYPQEDVAHIVSLAVDRNNEPWINIRQGTTFHLSHGTWTNETQAVGKYPGILGAMATADDGSVWIAFGTAHFGDRAGWLVRWDGTSFQKYSFADARFDISVASVAARGEHVWLAGLGGIVLFTHGSFYLMQFSDPNLPGRVSGILETDTGDLWTNGFNGITHVPASEVARWVQNPASKVVGEHLDALDGLPGLSAELFPEPSVIEGSDGRIWFATTKGIAWLNEASLVRLRNQVPPPVFVTSMIANGKAYPATPSLALPKHTQNLEIDYTALSLAVPERVSFRYRLDGVDKDWQEPGPRRQAFYTNLSPGRYRFHVTACNNDGVWNNQGAVFQFSIAPTFYQTNWFLVLCLTGFSLLAWSASQWRVRQAQARSNLQMEERLSERARIARELHDTLLQSFQGLILSFQRVRNLLPGQPSQAVTMLDTALDKAERAIMEGRDAIHDIRTAPHPDGDFVEGISKLGRELAADGSVPHMSNFRVVVEGNPKAIDPFVKDEIYRIAREALRNAYSHAQAGSVEVEVRFEDKLFKVRVRDDGVGIDEKHLGETGRSRHYGLRGMRERARQIGGQLDVWTQPGAGTEIELTVPCRVAYKVDGKVKMKVTGQTGERK